MRRHMYAQRLRIDEDKLIKVCSYIFAIALWPVFVAAELAYQTAAILRRLKP
jgi:hypothetical protein